MITSEQVRAARALLRWEQRQLAEASGVSLPSIKRLETQAGLLAAQQRTSDAIKRTLEAAGVEFIPENGGGAGVRLKGATPARKPKAVDAAATTAIGALKAVIERNQMKQRR